MRCRPSGSRHSTHCRAPPSQPGLRVSHRRFSSQHRVGHRTRTGPPAQYSPLLYRLSAEVKQYPRDLESSPIAPRDLAGWSKFSLLWPGNRIRYFLLLPLRVVHSRSNSQACLPRATTARALAPLPRRPCATIPRAPRATTAPAPRHYSAGTAPLHTAPAPRHYRPMAR